MNLSAFTPVQPVARAAAPLHGSAAAGLPGLPIEHWLLADDGLAGGLLQAGPRSQRLSLEAMERQFAAALTEAATDVAR